MMSVFYDVPGPCSLMLGLWHHGGSGLGAAHKGLFLATPWPDSRAEGNVSLSQ